MLLYNINFLFRTCKINLYDAYSLNLLPVKHELKKILELDVYILCDTYTHDIIVVNIMIFLVPLWKWKLR